MLDRTWGDTYGMEQLEADIARIKCTFPHVTVTTCGESVLRKPIYSLYMGRGRRKMHLNAAVHANEWLTSAVVMAFVEKMAQAYVEDDVLRRLFDTVSLNVVPMVNPDGVQVVIDDACQESHERHMQHWKANARGVDLNDQFPAYWHEEVMRRGVTKPSAANYAGPHPLSEPEAVALATLTEREQFDLVISVHSQGEEIYWNYRDYEPANALAMAQQFAHLSGYEAVANYDSDAGFKDWFIYTYRKPGFTFELGRGVNPLPVQQFADIYKRVEPAFIQALVLTI